MLFIFSPIRNLSTECIKQVQLNYCLMLYLTNEGLHFPNTSNQLRWSKYFHVFYIPKIRTDRTDILLICLFIQFYPPKVRSILKLLPYRKIIWHLCGLLGKLDLMENKLFIVRSLYDFRLLQLGSKIKFRANTTAVNHGSEL